MKQKTETFAIANKNLVRVTSEKTVIDFATQIVILEIFVDDKKIPKYTYNCKELITVDQKTTKIIEFPTKNENMFIVAYTDDDSVDLTTLLVSGH